jgi:hypothetical protein
MLGFKRVMYLAAMLFIAPAGFMACNDEDEEETGPDSSVGDDAGSDTDGGDVDVDGGDADGGDDDAGLASELAP